MSIHPMPYEGAAPCPRRGSSPPKGQTYVFGQANTPRAQGQRRRAFYLDSRQLAVSSIRNTRASRGGSNCPPVTGHLRVLHGGPPPLSLSACLAMPRRTCEMPRRGCTSLIPVGPARPSRGRPSAGLCPRSRPGTPGPSPPRPHSAWHPGARHHNAGGRCQASVVRTDDGGWRGQRRQGGVCASRRHPW